MATMITKALPAFKSSVQILPNEIRGSHFRRARDHIDGKALQQGACMSAHATRNDEGHTALLEPWGQEAMLVLRGGNLNRRQNRSGIVGYVNQREPGTMSEVRIQTVSIHGDGNPHMSISFQGGQPNQAGQLQNRVDVIHTYIICRRYLYGNSLPKQVHFASSCILC